jgi:hypothetical protein
VPRLFAIWWTAWNDRHPLVFPLPASLLRLTTAAITLPSGYFLFDHDGTESEKGILIRKAWESLDSDQPTRNTRDFMMCCWCGKMFSSGIRLNIAHPVTSKEEAKKTISLLLCDDLAYLHEFALYYISTSLNFV